MKKLVNNLLRKILGLEICEYKSYPDAITLLPESVSKGNVLLSYIIDPFLVEDESMISNSHTHHWESYLIAKAFLQMGYAVDVISYLDNRFVPKKNYTLFIAARTNFERIAKLLNRECIKIAHLDTSHWIFNNSAILKRSLDVQQRHGVSLTSFKFIEYNWAVEHAGYATVLGNQFTVDTYQYSRKKIYKIPISTCNLYPWRASKEFDECRRHFLWFGSDGLVHKGLDLVLDAFVSMPENHLYVCGPISDDPQFEKAFNKELYHTSNIHTVGWVDVESDEFLNISNQCAALVYPSCAEGGGGSVIQCMHSGLVPVVSYESSVDISDEYGFILEEFSVSEIIDKVRCISALPAERLEKMSRKAWEYARENHTREHFYQVFRQTMQAVISNHEY